MTDIEAKALALVNEVNVGRGYAPYARFDRDFDHTCEALCRAIEQHEAFEQKVSDIVEAYVNATSVDDWEKLKSLIIPKPKPDPLLEAVGEAMQKHEVYSKYELTDSIRAALEARGLEIRSKKDD